MSYIKTAYADLMGIKEIIKISNSNFYSVHVYPTFRDICLLLYQINKEILNNSIALDEDINTIRHRVHLHRNKNNYKTYRKILKTSISMFGNDIDNLGFYFKGSQLIGSTIYPCYIFMDTNFFSKSPEDLRKNTFEFAKLVGKSTTEILQTINLLAPEDLPFDLNVKFNKELSTDNYALKIFITESYSRRLKMRIQ